MNSLLVKYPYVLKWLYSKRLSRLKSPKTIYLTFDDGPIPEVTPWVLAELKKYKAKATFFCIGENIKKHPEIFQQIIAADHQVGNHTYNHLNGWKTSTRTYIENIFQAETVITKIRNKRQRSRIKHQLDTKQSKKRYQRPLFRPPFGKIRNSQAKLLTKKGYQIVMWDVVSWDFHKEISKEKCLENVINNAKEGSIIVFHDSLKAEKNLKYTLPKVLTYFVKKDFEFKSLTGG